MSHPALAFVSDNRDVSARLVLIIVAAVSLLAAGWVLADLLQGPSPSPVEPIVVESPGRAGAGGAFGARPSAPEDDGQDGGGAAPAPPPPVAPAGSGSGSRDEDLEDDTQDGSVSLGGES